MSSAEESKPVGGFRFYDNRQKYLLFVNTCSEKWVVAERVARELEQIEPQQPAIRFFDAGIGDGTVLTCGCSSRRSPTACSSIPRW